MSDVVERAIAALEGVTPGPWHHRQVGTSEAHGQWMADTLTGFGPLHVIIADSPVAKYAYLVPAVTGDGPTGAINAEFIASARELMPELIAEIRALRDVIRWEHGK